MFSGMFRKIEAPQGLKKYSRSFKRRLTAADDFGDALAARSG